MTSWTLGMFFIEGQGRRLERHLIILLYNCTHSSMSSQQQRVASPTSLQPSGQERLSRLSGGKRKLGGRKFQKIKKIYLLPPDSIPEFAAVA